MHSAVNARNDIMLTPLQAVDLRGTELVDGGDVSKTTPGCGDPLYRASDNTVVRAGG